MENQIKSSEELAISIDIVTRIACLSMAKSCTETEVRFFFEVMTNQFCQIYDFNVTERMLGDFRDGVLKMQESLAEEFPPEPPF